VTIDVLDAHQTARTMSGLALECGCRERICFPWVVPVITLHSDSAVKGTMSTPQFIYVMKGLRKVVPPNREILRGIWLSFYPGAKIGVVGPNGSGKSSLLRIMAGVDTDFQGEAWAAKGTRVSYLAQEPQLDPALNVRGNVEEAVRPIRELLKRFDEVNMKFAEPMSD
jgi:sulfate-transporting ATPase